MRALHSRRRGESPDGKIAVDSWIQVVCTAIQEVLDPTDWSSAFAENGFGPAVVFDASPRVVAHIGGDVAALCADRPTDDQLSAIFPSNRPPAPWALLAPLCRLRRLAIVGLDG